jgi:hypothetical protein
MESHSLPGKIQVSSETFERLRARYRFVARTGVNVKGIGVIPTWFLEGKIV